MENIFRIFSRYIVFIPIGIIVIALLLRFNTNTQVRSNIIVSPSPTIAQTPLAVQPTTSPAFTIDLTTERVCSYSTTDKEATAYIKNNNAYAEITAQGKTSINIINGDCLYQWNKGEIQGQKVCGMTTMLTALQTLNNMGVLSEDMLQQAAEQTGSSDLSPQELLQIMQSCNKTTVDEARFIVPQNIQFTEEVNPIK